MEVRWVCLLDIPTFYDDFGRLVLESEWMLADMLRRAEAGAAFAQTIAPRDTEAFADSIKGVAVIRPATGPYKRRAVGRVIAEDQDAFQIEHGTRDTPAHRTLGRCLDIMRTA